MKLFCVKGIPRRLFAGVIYSQVASFYCCGGYNPPRLVSVAESVGHTAPMHCSWCRNDVPAAQNVWFDAARFIPWEPPQIAQEELDTLFEPDAGLTNAAARSASRIVQVERAFLSRRNLQTLISKLDRKARGEATDCTIFKCDHAHPRFPQSMR